MPDATLDLHSCGSGPFFLLGDAALPESFNRHSYYIEGFARGLLHERLGVHRSWTAPGFEGALTINSAYFHLCGTLPLLFEGTQGADEGNRHTHAQIVDTYLTVFEAVMTVGVLQRFKPRR